MNTAEKIRVLVVDDSLVERDLLSYLLETDPRLSVAGTAADGEEALAEVARLKPDVVTMDIHMPRMDGIEATRRIMETTPTPIVIVSGNNVRAEVVASFRAMEAGALAIVEKPMGIEGEAVDCLRETLRLMAEVKVVRRWPRPAARPAPTETAVALVAMGASTGGPLALETLLHALPRNFPAPIAIVQHMASGFIEGFAEWLAEASDFPVQLASAGTLLLPGHAYVAPDGAHLLVEVDATGKPRASLAHDLPEKGHRPAVARLFQSAADNFGASAIGVLLTGMGRDGAAELKAMRDHGALTIAQSPESAVVAGMPGEAIALGGAGHVLAPEQIAQLLRKTVEHLGSHEAATAPGQAYFQEALQPNHPL